MEQPPASADPNAALQRLQDGLHRFGTVHDPDFVGVLLTARGAVVYRTSEPTDELVARYGLLLEGTGRSDLEFRLATVRDADRKRAVNVLTRASDEMRDHGFQIWTIRHGRPGEAVVVSYEDPQGRGIPASLLAELAPLPEGTVEFLRDGPRAVGIAHRSLD